MTEYNYGDIWENPDLTEANGLTKAEAYCNMLDTASFIERYCYFTWQPGQTEGGGHTSMTKRSPVVLNSIGNYYSTHESLVAYTQEVHENGPDMITEALNTVIKHQDISCYPNPVITGILTISYGEKDPNQELTIKLYNFNGQEIKLAYNSPQSLNISDLNNQIYLIHIEGNGFTYSEKIIIKAK